MLNFVFNVFLSGRLLDDTRATKKKSQKHPKVKTIGEKKLVKKPTAKKPIDTINYCSIGSSSGIFEHYMPEMGFKSTVACEIVPKRAHFYKQMHPGVHMVNKSIADKDAKTEIIDWCKKTHTELIVFTLACQGSSTMSGKTADEKSADPRNYLFMDALDVIEKVKPKWVICENVVQYYNVRIGDKTSEQIMKKRLEKAGYTVAFYTLNAANYGTPQARVRRYMLAYCGNKKWNVPAPTTPKHITVYDAIGHLESLEPGQQSKFDRLHAAPNVRQNLIDVIKYIPSGGKLSDNPAPYNVAYKKDGITPISYKFAGVFQRADWNKPSHTILTASGNSMAQFGLHPGHRIGRDKNGLPIYDNCRPFTIRELILLTGLPKNFDFPKGMSDNQIRIALGEQACPLMMKMFLANRPE